MIRRLYNWIMRLAAGPNAERALFAVAFAEASFFPIPPDVMLIPMCLAERRKALRFAAVCTVGSVLGGMLGYAIGYYLVESLGRWLLHLYGQEAALEVFRQQFAEIGLWFILIKGLTPIPYKVVTIAAGAAQFSLALFIGASILTRGLRFFAVAALLWKFGEPIREFVEKRLTLIATISVIVIVGGFVAVRYLF